MPRAAVSCASPPPPTLTPSTRRCRRRAPPGRRRRKLGTGVHGHRRAVDAAGDGDRRPLIDRRERTDLLVDALRLVERRDARRPGSTPWRGRRSPPCRLGPRSASRWCPARAGQAVIASTWCAASTRALMPFSGSRPAWAAAGDRQRRTCRRPCVRSSPPRRSAACPSTSTRPARRRPFLDELARRQRADLLVAGEQQLDAVTVAERRGGRGSP